MKWLSITGMCSLIEFIFFVMICLGSKISAQIKIEEQVEITPGKSDMQNDKDEKIIGHVFEPLNFDGIEGEEILSERTEYMKVFQLPDGMKKARIYAGPIHYKSSAGKYENIDPKLMRASSANQGSRALMKQTADSYDYEYIDGLYTASFKRDLFEENSVRINLESGYTFKTSLVGIGYFNTNSHEYRLFNDFNPVLMEPEDAQLTYSDSLLGIDIKYSYMTESLKEEIYLNQQFRDALPEPEQYGWDRDNTEFVIITEINPDDQLDILIKIKYIYCCKFYNL